MFRLTYVFQELRDQRRRSVVAVLIFALGASSIVGLASISKGLEKAPSNAVKPLQEVGADILVTHIAGVSPRGNVLIDSKSGAANESRRLADRDAELVASENSNVLTDLSRLGKPNDTFTHDFFASAAMMSFSQESINQIASIEGVETFSSGLTQLVQHKTGKLPDVADNSKTSDPRVRLRPISPAQQHQQYLKCMQDKESSQRSAQKDDLKEAEKCQEEASQQALIPTSGPLLSIQKLNNSSQTDVTTTDYVVAGIDLEQPTLGIITKDQLASGRWINKDVPNEVLVSKAYASQNSLEINSKIKFGETDYTVVGLVDPVVSGHKAEVYFALPILQQLANKPTTVNHILVRVAESGDIDNVMSRLRALFRDAQIVSTRDLLERVDGEVIDLKPTANRIITVITKVALAVSSLILLRFTWRNITKRKSEWRILNRTGWSKKDIAIEIVFESLAIGVLAGFVAIVLGILLCVCFGLVGLDVSAKVTELPGVAGSPYSQLFGQPSTAVSSSVNVGLHPQVQISKVLTTFGFTIAASLFVGTICGLRGLRLIRTN